MIALRHNGKVVCFFRSGQMDKARYSTFGFSVTANLDVADDLWPTSYALASVSKKAWGQFADSIKAAMA